MDTVLFLRSNLPNKLMRDWTALFVSGCPQYETTSEEHRELTPEQILEEERQSLLDNGDFTEYKVIVCTGVSKVGFSFEIKEISWAP